MDIKVSGRKTTVTDALRAHVDEKIGEALKVFDIEPMTVDVVLRYEKNPSNPNPAIVEVTVRARGSVIRVAEHGADMYAAIDLSADKVTRQLRKFKTKVVDNRQGGASAADVAPVTTSTCSRTRRPVSSMWCITVRMVDMASSSPASKHLTSKIR